MRDANNGITGAIDPYGRVLSRLDLDAIGVLDTPLPAALASTRTAESATRLPGFIVNRDCF